MKIVYLLILFFFISNANAYSLNEDSYVSLFSGYGVLASELSGSGFNSDLPANGGTLYGIEGSYQPDSSFNQYLFKYERIAVDQNSPNGISPENMSTSREELRLLTKFSPWDSGILENVKIGVGYAFLASKGSATLPNAVVTNQHSQGVILNAAYVFEISDDTVVMPEASVYLPHRFSESLKSTGHNPNYIGLEVGSKIESTFTDNIHGFIGAIYRIDEVSFDGAGDRGVTNGNDTRIYFSVPVGLKIVF